MKGRAFSRPDYVDAWEISIFDNNTKIPYTVKFEAHQAQEGRCSPIPTTIISERSFEFEALKALAHAMRDMDLLPNDAVKAELEATKYHLEDMRKLALGARS